MSADALVREITAFYRRRRHDEVVDAIILAALEPRGVSRGRETLQVPVHDGTLRHAPDGAIVLEDGTVVAIDATVIGNGEDAAEQIRRKEHGGGRWAPWSGRGGSERRSGRGVGRR